VIRQPGEGGGAFLTQFGDGDASGGHFMATDQVLKHLGPLVTSPLAPRGELGPHR
jgi:hypothetical protein